MSPALADPRVVVIGAGIVGCSLADELTARGWTDVTVLEQGPAARPRRLHLARARPRLPDQPVEDPDGVRAVHRREVHAPSTSTASPASSGSAAWRWPPPPNASPTCTAGPDRRLLGRARRDRRRRTLQGTVAAARRDAGPRRLPHPGRRSGPGPARLPAQMTRASARGARFLERHTVTGIERADGQVTGVVTDRGTFPADHVVSAAGFWGPVIGAMAGVDVPLLPLAHQYARTEPLPELSGRDRAGTEADPAVPGPRPVLPRAHATASASAPTPTARCPSTPSPSPPSTRRPEHGHALLPALHRGGLRPELAGLRRLHPRTAPPVWRASTASSPSPPTGCRYSANPGTCAASGSPRPSGSPTPPALPRPSPSG